MDGDFVENTFEQELERSPLPGRDRALCQELVYGVVRWQSALDWLISRRTGGREQKPGTQQLLRLGLYQLFWLDRVPDHAAVNETVDMAREGGFGHQAGFLNAILRGCLRERDAMERELAELKHTDPARGYSHPGWLFQRWLARWGTAEAAKLMEWNNTPPHAFARVNTLATDPGTLLQHWRERDGIEYEFFLRDWVGENLCFELKTLPPLAQVESFQKGWFYIQDPSTILAVRLLDPKPGEAILDLCAAPGGKTTLIAQLMENKGRIVACDSAHERLKLLQDNCARLRATCVEAQPLSPDKATSPLFDRVLVDAPCSNTGVVRRRIEVRWRLRVEDLAELARLQLQLLSQAAAHVKPGGVLVYSTCSIEPEENSGVVAAFLAARPDFALETSRELVPFADRTDGAFAARFRRN